VGLVGRLAGIVPNHLAIAWWGLAKPRISEKAPLLIVQGVVLGDERVLLSVRSDLHGWELPGGNPGAGEPDEAALRREIFEETGVEVAVERHVGDYVRTGFRPHTARVFLCRATGGELRPSAETPSVRWFPIRQVPETLFPWYRAPLEDALADLSEPVERREYQGRATVWAGMKIDFRMRLSNDCAGLVPGPDPHLPIGRDVP
jgi:ADP-ribose pyrophosphatase YjhB (NUDIX family)